MNLFDIQNNIYISNQQVPILTL